MSSVAFKLLILFLAGYFLGNLNGSVLISRGLVHDDVRNHGSGNAGFTNFFRNYGGINSLLVFLIDALKAVIACLLGKMLLSPQVLGLEGAALATVAVVLGHDFPALLHFKGGKGIVCGFSCAVILDPQVAAVAFAVFALVYLATKYVSLSSVLGAFVMGCYFALRHSDRPWAVAGCVFACGLAIFMHRENIVRLCHGTERKTDFFKKEHRS